MTTLRFATAALLATPATAAFAAVNVTPTDYTLSASLSPDVPLTDAHVFVWSYAFDGERNYSVEITPVGDLAGPTTVDAAGRLDVLFYDRSTGDDFGDNEKIHFGLLANTDGGIVASLGAGAFDDFTPEDDYASVLFRGSDDPAISEDRLSQALAEGDAGYLETVLFDTFAVESVFNQTNGRTILVTEFDDDPFFNESCEGTLAAFDPLRNVGTFTAQIGLNSEIPEPAGLSLLLACGGLLLRRR